MQIPTTMAAAAPYPIPLMTTFTWSYGHHITPTKRESRITRASQQYHCHIFSTAGSPTAAHLRYCTGTNDISPTMAATDAPHDNLPMDLRPQYCTDRAPITSTLHDNHQIIFPAAGSLSVDRLRVELYLHEIPTTMAATDTPYDHHPMELQPWYCTRRAPITST